MEDKKLAYRNYRRTTKGKKRKSKYTELERLAYNMGKVKRGISNPDSRVHVSYNNGLKGKTTSKKKPLI